MSVRHVVSWVVLLGPLAVLLGDLFLYLVFGYESTITGVVRGWASRSPWPELIYLGGALLLYLHLYRDWP